MSNTLTTLDSNALDAVTGGKSLTGGKTSSNDAVLSTLTDLQGSIKDLAKPAQQSAFGNPTNMMLFALLASRPQPATQSVVVVPRRSW